jgi:tRNA G18 (ribose-2'-O)-methylase SpoU
MIAGVFLECSEKICRFRFPVFPAKDNPEPCPKCGGKTFAVENVSLASEDHNNGFRRHPQGEIIPILDNIRSIYNVGSIFRTANGFGVSRIYLGGISPTPNHPGFFKTSLGAEKTIAWEHTRNALVKIKELKHSGFQIISLENTHRSITLDNLSNDQLFAKILLVLGNEKLGIDPGILRDSDILLSIPMLGSKQSHNVCVAFGIAIFQLSNILFKSANI